MLNFWGYCVHKWFKTGPTKIFTLHYRNCPWFYIPNLWLLHRFHRQHSYRKSCKVKEKHFCFYITLFYIPSAPYSTLWDQRREKFWILYQLLFTLWTLEKPESSLLCPQFYLKDENKIHYVTIQFIEAFSFFFLQYINK